MVGADPGSSASAVKGAQRVKSRSRLKNAQISLLIMMILLPYCT
jgi:hypothetical protein